MRTVAIARLKVTLSAELRRVRAGESVTVLDRITPVEMPAPLPESIRVVHAAKAAYRYRPLPPLTARDPAET